MSHEFDDFDTQIQSDELREADRWADYQEWLRREEEENVERQGNVEVDELPKCSWCDNQAIGFLDNDGFAEPTCAAHKKEYQGYLGFVTYTLR